MLYPNRLSRLFLDPPPYQPDPAKGLQAGVRPSGSIREWAKQGSTTAVASAAEFRQSIVRGRLRRRYRPQRPVPTGAAYPTRRTHFRGGHCLERGHLWASIEHGRFEDVP